MFEAQVAYYLNKYLGGYVDGIDEQSLTYASSRRVFQSMITNM